MNPERWQRIKQLLDEAIALEDAERGPYLDRACAADFELRSEVESLLSSHEQAGTGFLNSPAINLKPEAQSAPVRAGRHIGVYRIVEEIGRGGMGEIYRAVRADGQYTKEVAVKLVRGGLDTASVLERFRTERQILATLDHPNIARLLDGGTTEDGIPYLVMELIEGTRIDLFCDEHKLSITRRLQLFRQVCAAVQYAHQRLVIHRDIKPSNILVTKESVPKLLDFGIAKILDPASGGATTIERPMTPEYASPEQIRGEPITTASDVYSLGVVLYQLLTGRSPYPGDTRSSHELARAVCETDPGRPSVVVLQPQPARAGEPVAPPTPEQVSNTREGSPAKLHRRLAGDLDDVALMALRKEPGRRYASVEQFAEDVRRHLEGLPVTATKASWNYRAGKFIQRHKASVAATALVLLTLVAGVVITLREARIAEANRHRAEARFNDVRKLANSLIFEIHDSIADLPGATEARKLIMQRSLEYLDSLTKESGNDPVLLRELATAYDRIGNLQGNPHHPNMGDTKSALASLQKSMQIRESLGRLNPKNGTDQVELAVAYIGYCEFLHGAAGDVATGYAYCRKATAMLDRALAASPSNERIIAQSTRAYVSLGEMEVGEGAMGKVGTTSEGIEDLQKALQLVQRAIQIAPSNVHYLGEEGGINAILGDAMLDLGDRPQALTYYHHALDILQALNPKDNIRAAVNTVVIIGKIGDALLVEGYYSESIVYYSKAQKAAEQLATIDRHNEALQRAVITTSGQLGHALVAAGRMDEGLAYFRKADAVLKGALASTPLTHIFEGILYTWTGQALDHKGKTREAMQQYAKGKEVLAAVRAGGTNDPQVQVYFLSTTDSLAATLARLGKTDEARIEYEQALALLDPLSRTTPDDQRVLYALAETYTGEGTLYAKLAESSHLREERLANWNAAQDRFQKSLYTWSQVSHPARFTTSGMEVTLPDEVSRRLARCNLELASLGTSGSKPH